MRSVSSWLLVLASALFAQLDEDHFEVALKFDHGRFVTDRATAKVNLSARYKKLLRPGVTNEQTISAFCDALDREFQIMPAPYFFTLTDQDKERDRTHTLDNPDVEKQRRWNGTVRDFPGVGILGTDRTNRGGFNEHVEKVRQRSGLAALVNETDDLNRPLRFRLREPLTVDKLDTPELGKMLDRNGVLKKLRPLDGLPANPELMQAVILDFYTPRGITPMIALQLDASPPTLSIFEASRIARILLPKELTDLSLAQRIVYESLPHRVFVAFREKGGDELNRPIGDGATKREIDLHRLVNAATFSLPPVEPSLLAQIQQRLLPLHHTASLFDYRPKELLFDLVIDPTTAQKGSGSETNPITGTAATPPNAPQTTSRPGAEIDVQPSPVVPAPAPNPNRSGNTPQEEKRHFIGGGFEYRPGQGVRALGSYQLRNALEVDLLRIDVGGTGSGFGTAHYSRDYLFFDTLGRRLTADVEGGSDYERQRILDNILTNERRTGGALRLDLEAFRDWAGQHLSFFVEGRHQQVRLTAAQPENTPRPETVTNLSTIDAGLSHSWRRTVARPSNFRIEPSVRFGVGFSRTEPAFRTFRLAVQYHQSLAGPIEGETRFQGRAATENTPVFELPSLGGGDSVRGFRRDESIGRRLWAWQSELWFPVFGGGPPSTYRNFIRRNVRLAALYDAGSLSGLAPGLPDALEGFRHGTGLGLRVKYQGVVVETDWVYGFGSDAKSRPGRGRFYFNFRLP